MNLSGPLLAHEQDSLYIRGIRQAEKLKNAEGTPLIRYSSDKLRQTLGADVDGYCHVDTPTAVCAGVASTNSRSLNEMADWILVNSMQDHAEKIRLLFLGPGYGWECAQARRHLPDAYIVTRSRSPIDPFHMPLLPMEKMHRAMQQLIHDRSWQSSSATKELAIQLDACSDSYPVSLLLAIDEHLPEPVFFSRLLHTPFIDEQEIGMFPHETPLQGQYHLLYDGYGPFHKMTPDDVLSALKDIQIHVHDDGVLIIDTLPSALLSRAADVADSIQVGNTAMLNENLWSLVVGSSKKIEDLQRFTKPWSIWQWKRLGTW